MLSYNDFALVLRRFPYGEKDYILSLFTKNQGRVRVVAKGVRSVKSRRGGHLDLFNEVKIQVRTGYGLGILTEAQVVNDFANAKKQLDVIGQYYYVSEILEHLVPEEEKNYIIYQETQKLLRNLNEVNLDSPAESNLDALLRDFEVFLLRHQGYWSDEIHQKAYPKEMLDQRRFNQYLIQEASERPIKSSLFIDKLGS